MVGECREELVPGSFVAIKWFQSFAVKVLLLGDIHAFFFGNCLSYLISFICASKPERLLTDPLC